MNKFKFKLVKIKNELIRKSFPELKNSNILIFATPFRGHYSGLAIWSIWPFLNIICINRKRYKESIKYLKGLLVHEISHIALVKKRGIIKSAIRGMFYWIIPKLRRAEEDDTNKLAIERGYSREIYLITKKSEKRKISAKIQKFYMSSEEIKAYARKIEKW